MSGKQKQNKKSEQEIKNQRDIIIKEYAQKPYWTLKEGINLLTPGLFSLNVNSPSENDTGFSPENFENLLRSIEIQNDYIFTPIKDIEELIDDYRKYSRFVFSEKRTMEPNGRRDLINFIGYQNKLLHSIKVDPGLFIEFVKNKPTLFSGCEIPLELENLQGNDCRRSNTVENIENEVHSNSVTKSNDEKLAELLVNQGKGHNTENKLSLEDQLNKLIIELTPEIELLYKEIKTIAKALGRNAQFLEYEDGKTAFDNLQEQNEFQLLKLQYLNPDSFVSGKAYRAIKGDLLRKVVIRTMPKLIGNKKDIKIDGQALYKRMTDLKKTS